MKIDQIIIHSLLILNYTFDLNLLSIVDNANPPTISSICFFDDDPKDFMSSVARIIKAAPTLTDSDNDINSFDIKGYYCEKFGTDRARVRFRLCYKKPGQYSLILRDDIDGTPLLYSSQGKMLEYNAIGPHITITDDAIIRATFASTEDGFLTQKVTSYRSRNETNFVYIDFRSVLKNQFASASTEVIDDRTARYTRTSPRGNKLCILIKPGEKFSCHGCSLTMAGEDNPSFAFESITVNTKLKDDLFAFPVVEAGHLEISVKKPSPDDDEILSSIACYARAALKNRAKRGDPEFPKLTRLDWDNFGRADAKLSDHLKQLLKDK